VRAQRDTLAPTVGNLDHDTTPSGADGRYTIVLSGDWRIWGPNGGYLAAIALRAGLVGAHGRIWSEDGRLIASGGAQLLSIPNPRPPTPPAGPQNQSA